MLESMYATHEVFQISEALLNFLIKRTMQLTLVTVFLAYDYNMVSLILQRQDKQTSRKLPSSKQPRQKDAFAKIVLKTDQF